MSAAKVAAHDLGLSVAEMASLSREFDRACADVLHRGDPDEVAYTVLGQLAELPDGRQILADAQATFRAIRQRHPAVAQAILDTGPALTVELLRQLAGLRRSLR